MSPAAPRIYVIPAQQAQVAAVFRRGPATWWQIGRWDLASGEYESGAWFRGRIYPRRCDLSPDGKLLYYFACKVSSREFMGEARFHDYSAVSKLPWLFALAAWKEIGSWTRGYHFTMDKKTWEIGDADHGDATPIRKRFGLARTNPEQYATELRRGWRAHEACPPRSPTDAWDENRNAILQKTRAKLPGRLVLTDHGWSARGSGRIEGRAPSYRVEVGTKVVELDAMWADWDPVGRLVIATSTGCLQIRDAVDLVSIRHEADLRTMKPSPEKAPASAQRW